MSRRGRSRSRSSYYSQVGEQYVDIKSMQLLFHQAAVCTLGRTRLENNENFDEAKAEELLQDHLRKRKSHGYVMCLVDRIRFQKNKNTASKSYRDDLTYREIKHFYQFKAHPDVFMLCVHEELTGKRTYESYKCKKQEDVLILHDLTARAFQDPQFLLRDAVPMMQISRSPPLSNDSRLNNGPSDDHNNNNNTITVLSANPNRNSTIYYNNVDQRSSVQRTISPPSRHSPDYYSESRSRPISIERRIDQKDRSSTIGVFPIRNSSNWSDDITYLKNDSEHGPQLTDYGPIYLYVSRAQHVDTDNNYLDDQLSYTPRSRISYR